MPHYGKCASGLLAVAFACIAFTTAAVLASSETLAGNTIVEFDLLMLDGSGYLIPTAAATDQVVGVARDGASADEKVTYQTTGEVECKCDAGVAIGEYVAPSSTAGTTGPGTASPGTYTFGVARTATAGGTCQVLLMIKPNAAGGSVTAASIEAVEGMAQAELQFSISMDNNGDDPPVMWRATRALEVAAASVVGWVHLWGLNNDVQDSGTDGLSPSAGTGLPSGVSGIGDGLQFGGDGSAANFIDLGATSSLSIADTENVTFVGVFNSPTISGAIEVLVDLENISTGNGFFASVLSTSSKCRVRATATSDIEFGELDDGADHTVVGIYDQTDMTGIVDGSQVSQVADNRSGTATGAGDNAGIGGQVGSTAFTFAGVIKFLGWFKGLVPIDFGAFFHSLPAADRHLIGSRYLPGKFGEGRLYLGGDYEDYASDVWQAMRAEGALLLWLQPVFDADSATITADPVLFYLTTDGTDYWKLYYDVSDDDWVFEVVSGGTTTVARTTSVQTFNKTDWIHLAMTWDATNLTLYVNGTEAQQTAVATEIGPTGELAANMRFGNEGTDSSCNCVLDHVKGLKRVVTATEVTNEATATRPF